MADALDWLRQMLGGGQDAQPGGGALGQLQSRLAAEDQVQTPPQNWRLPDLAALTGMPSALEQSAAATAANPWQPGMTAGQMLAGRPEDPLASSFQPGVGVGAIRAYHGSPALFAPESGAPLGRFRWDKIGTGEGAQAYGYAPAYVAENEGVARGYRDALTRPPTNHPLSDNSGTIPDWIANQIRQYPPGHEYYNSTIDKAKELFHGRIGEQDAQWPSQPWMAESNKKGLQEIVDNLGRLRSGDVTLAPLPKGHMYEVQINAEPEHFLDWDKPLSQQSEQVRAVMAQLGIPETAPVLNNPAEAMPGSSAYERLSLAGEDPRAPGTAYRAREGAAAASRQLAEAGIPGVRYLDQGSRAAGAGSHNYAVWMPELITIMRRYGILPPLAAGAAGAGLLGAGSEPPT